MMKRRFLKEEENHFNRPHHCFDFEPDLASKDSSPSVDWLDWKGFHVFQFCLGTIPLTAASMFSRLWTSSVSVFYCLQESSFVVWGLEEEGREFQVVRLSLRPFSSPEDKNLNYRTFIPFRNSNFDPISLESKLFFSIFIYILLTESGSMSWGLDTSGQSRKELVDVSEQFEEVECWKIIINFKL